MQIPKQLSELLNPITMLVLDVDGVLTEGLIYYSTEKHEIKPFNIKDGLGIKLLQSIGVQVAIITGRRSEMVKRRANELGIELLIQGREDKGEALKNMAAEQNISLNTVAYMGDDLPDLSAMRIVAAAIAPADAHWSVSKQAHWVTQAGGGKGAVREVCDALLLSKKQYSSATADYTDK